MTMGSDLNGRRVFALTAKNLSMRLETTCE